jgi:proteasome accessory factor C
VAEVCQRFGVSEHDLLADLDLLFMCGVYPYTPDALIEVDIDGGRVWVRFAEWFRRPLRLTAPEGLALVAAARAMLAVPAGAPGSASAPAGTAPVPAVGSPGPGDEVAESSALASAVAKLEMVLGGGGDEALDIELGAASPDVLGLLATATSERRKVRLEYYSFGRDATAQRVVHPWRVFSSEGHWYLLAWCESASDKRLFRVDRTRGAMLLDEHFEPPGRVGPVPIYEGKPDDPLVVLDVAPGARWMAERYPNEGSDDLGGGHICLRLRASSKAWLERLLLRAGPDATVLSGAEGVAEAAAGRVLALYRPVTSKE